MKMKNNHQPPVPQADGFRATLQTLAVSDLPFLTPATTATTVQDTVQRPVLKKRRQRSRSASPDAAISAATSPAVPMPDAIIPAPAETARTDPALAGDTTVPASPMSSVNDGLIPPRKRKHVERIWPPIGTKLEAEYFGVTYHAEVVAATKRLKSGKQIRLLDGPGKGKRLNTYSKAMLVATARQRRAGKLGRKNASNGWSFWGPAGPAAVDPAGSVSAPVVQPVPVVSPTAQPVAS
jgi:hypothetical protein